MCLHHAPIELWSGHTRHYRWWQALAGPRRDERLESVSRVPKARVRSSRMVHVHCGARVRCKVFLMNCFEIACRRLSLAIIFRSRTRPRTLAHLCPHFACADFAPWSSIASADSISTERTTRIACRSRNASRAAPREPHGPSHISHLSNVCPVPRCDLKQTRSTGLFVLCRLRQPSAAYALRLRTPTAWRKPTTRQPRRRECMLHVPFHTA